MENIVSTIVFKKQGPTRYPAVSTPKKHQKLKPAMPD
jgi:hypothetical protein